MHEIRTVLDQVVGDTLALSNSVPRNRAVGYLLGVMMEVLELVNLEARIMELEATGTDASTRSPRSRIDRQLEPAE